MKKLIITIAFIYINVNAYCQFQWAKQLGSSYVFYDDFINSLVSDGANEYVIGSFGGTLNLPGDTTISSSGNNDCFVAKYDANGNFIWATRFGGNFTPPSAHEFANGVYDPINNCLYITGTFITNISLGSTTLTSANGDQEIFVARMDLNGNFIWAKKINSIGNDYAYIFAKPDGNILLEGHLINPTTIDTFAVIAGGFFASYDNNGNVQWAKHKMDGPDAYQVSIVFIDNDFVIAGVAGPGGIATVDTSTFTVNGNYDGFLARFDSVANMKWIKIIGGSGDGGIGWISVDANKNIYGAGSIKDTMTIGGTTLYHPVYDYLVTKFDENGNLIWSKTGNSSGLASASCILSDAIGNCYVSGGFQGGVTFGTNTLSASTSQDMFISKFDENGNCYGVYAFGEASATGITSNLGGSIFVGGTFKNTANIGSTSVTSFGNNDIFLTKIDAFVNVPEKTVSSNDQLIIYANPNKGTCNIIVPNNMMQEENLMLNIYTSQGRLIQQVPVETKQEKVQISLEEEAKGIYNVTIGNSKKIYSGKIVFE